MQRNVFPLVMGLGVALGAFGAHALKDHLGPYELDIWKTATLYLFVHGVAGLWAHGQGLWRVCWCFLLGTLFFSGSLFALALSGLKILGAVTPIGGLLFLVGWGIWGWTAWKSPSTSSPQADPPRQSHPSQG